MLLKGEVLSRSAKPVSAKLADEASVESIFDDLQQFEVRKRSKQAVPNRRALVICLAMQKDRWPLRAVLRQTYSSSKRDCVGLAASPSTHAHLVKFP
jgi:hypothetical protein